MLEWIAAHAHLSAIATVAVICCFPSCLPSGGGGRERSTAGRFHTEQNCFSLCVSVGYLYWATRVSRDNRQTRDITGEAEILTSGATQLSVEVVSLVAQMIGHREVQESKESSPGIQCSSFLHAKYMEVLIWPPNLPLPGMRS